MCSITVKALPVLLIAATVHAGCKRTDWSRYMHKRGMTTCDRYGNIIAGFYYNKTGIPDITNQGLEQVKCCNKPKPWLESYKFQDEDWRESLKGKDLWANCSAGAFLNGLFKRKGGWKSGEVRKGRCTTALNHPKSYDYCYNHETKTWFEDEGWTECRNGTYVVALHFKGCPSLSCVDKLRCCKF